MNFYYIYFRRHILQELQYYIIDPTLFPISPSYSQSITSSSSSSSSLLFSSPAATTSLLLTPLNLATNDRFFQSSLSSTTNGLTPTIPPLSSTPTEQKLEKLKEHLNIYFDGMTPLCDILWLEDSNMIVLDDIFQVIQHYNLVVNIRPL